MIMVFPVIRDEFLLGSYATAAANQLTKLALNRLGIEAEDHSTFKVLSIAATNIGLYYATGCPFVTIPGFTYGLYLSVKECFPIQTPEAKALENQLWGTGEDPKTFTELYKEALRENKKLEASIENAEALFENASNLKRELKVSSARFEAALRRNQHKES